MNVLPVNARKFINQFQGGFPISRRPFLQVAAKLGLTESALIALINDLVRDGYLSRFGPLFDVSRMGGSQILAAMAVPESRFPEVVDLVNGFDSVAHNYRRQHELNMWFVVSAESAELIQCTVEEIESMTGLRVYRFPKDREFYVGLFLKLDAGGGVETVSRDTSLPSSDFEPVRQDRDLIVCCQEGLPLVTEPYEEIAKRMSMPATEVMDRLRRLHDHGVIRRIGAIPNHYRLGLRANGMTVWNVSDNEADAVGQKVGALPFVSHCYLRPRHLPVWPYNLFAMVHGADRRSVESKRAMIRELLGSRSGGDEVLYSSEILKKTGLKLAA